MDDYKQHLRRLAVRDDALIDELAVDGRALAPTVLDDKTAALIRVAATVAFDAAPYSFQHAVALALDAGATSDEVVASLEALKPVTGRRTCGPVRPEGRARARPRRRRRARAA